MAGLQNKFLEQIKVVIKKQFGINEFFQGQEKENRARFISKPTLFRGFEPSSNEYFEFGDLRFDLENATVVIEFESDKVALTNLVKYWAFLKGKLTREETKQKLVICYFSSWRSYGTHRQLFDWIVEQIKEDKDLREKLFVKQFDHFGDLANFENKRDETIIEAVNWIKELNKKNK